ncbi:MAG: hypothetical protein EPN79_14420 [Burkholderiaceae bacterium]|nr:MAG: hypothetical protein EPN79_14420 [Burkholderiaceae bacterium]TBR75571.1 MAG: hypothetical protein EPN64_12115 [Burkholderiaceae bacterium]
MNRPAHISPPVHLVVKVTAMDGTRLNPRKADLHRWREGFAQALREHGVEAAATTIDSPPIGTKFRLERLSRCERYPARHRARRWCLRRTLGHQRCWLESPCPLLSIMRIIAGPPVHKNTVIRIPATIANTMFNTVV